MPMPKPTPEELKRLFRDSKQREELAQTREKWERRRRVATTTVTIPMVLLWVWIFVKLLPRLHRMNIDWGSLFLFPPGTR